MLASQEKLQFLMNSCFCIKPLKQTSDGTEAGWCLLSLEKRHWDLPRLLYVQ